MATNNSDYLKRNEELDFGKILTPPPSNTKVGVLTITNGHKLGIVTVSYTSNYQKQYMANFGTTSNEYRLLNHLSNNPNKVFSAKQLGGVLKQVRRDVDVPDDERRVRDTIRQIRVKLNLIGNPDDPFVSSNGFGLECKVERDL